MNLFEILLVVHLMAMAIWLGGAFVGVLIGIQMRRMDDPAPFAKFCQAFATIGGMVFGNAALLTLISGAWMVALEGGPGFGDLWVILGIAGWLVAAVYGAAVVGRSWQLVGVRLSEGQGLAEVGPMLKRAMTSSWIDLALRTAIVVLMVWRPV